MIKTEAGSSIQPGLLTPWGHTFILTEKDWSIQLVLFSKPQFTACHWFPLNSPAQTTAPILRGTKYIKYNKCCQCVCGSAWGYYFTGRYFNSSWPARSITNHNLTRIKSHRKLIHAHAHGTETRTVSSSPPTAHTGQSNQHLRDGPNKHSIRSHCREGSRQSLSNATGWITLHIQTAVRGEGFAKLISLNLPWESEAKGSGL